MRDLEETISIVRDAKRFALENLGISQNPSFTTTGDFKTYFIVYASRHDRIESVLGEWSNEPFDNPEECNRRENELQSQGNDTLQMTWETKGSNDCPITSSMTKISKTRLIYLVFHENWHIHCRLNEIKLQPNIEEAAGDCFAYQAALLYCDSNPQLKGNMKRDFMEWLQFYEFANKHTERLEAAYKTGVSAASEILQAARAEAKEISSRIISKEVRQRLNLPINNAFFVRVKYYAPMALSVYSALKDIHPKEYTTNKIRLSEALKRIETKT